jgi:hypothetical protein
VKNADHDDGQDRDAPEEAHEDGGFCGGCASLIRSRSPPSSLVLDWFSRCFEDARGRAGVVAQEPSVLLRRCSPHVPAVTHVTYLTFQRFNGSVPSSWIASLRNAWCLLSSVINRIG